MPNWTWDGNISARDVLLEAFIRNGDLIVTKVQADNYGGFELYFEDNLILQTFPAKATHHGEYEHWRLLNNLTNGEHFVVDDELLTPP